MTPQTQGLNSLEAVFQGRGSRLEAMPPPARAQFQQLVERNSHDHEFADRLLVTQWISTARDHLGGGHQGARCGLIPFDAAAKAAALMLQYAATNPEGGTLMAPDEVKSLVPEHLHEIAAQ